MDWTFIVFLIGLVAGGSIANVIFGVYYKPEGTLRIDHSNLEKDIYRIEINDLDGLAKKKHVVLKIDNHANLSQ